MAPKSANKASLEIGGMQVLYEGDKETLNKCRDMAKRGECAPLLGSKLFTFVLAKFSIRPVIKGLWFFTLIFRSSIHLTEFSSLEEIWELGLFIDNMDLESYKR
ncbi:uncharacterized protein [Rutidosis leptorrhynchoides]|uniref:uncharacterized protein n=1 Tax=Rutidosis leptorrhynchoides TaxID=125765 RepID=UPI003A99B3DB